MTILKSILKNIKYNNLTTESEVREYVEFESENFDLIDAALELNIIIGNRTLTDNEFDELVIEELTKYVISKL